MHNAVEHIIISATFSGEFLLPSLQYYKEQLLLDVSFLTTSYNQVFQQLESPDSIMNKSENALNVILIRFADALRFIEDFPIHKGSLPVSAGEQAGLDSFFRTLLHGLEAYSCNGKCPMLIIICPSSPEGGYADEWEQVFAGYADRLTDTIKQYPSIKVLNAADFHRIYGATAVYDSAGDTMGHFPYRSDYSGFLGTLITRYYYALSFPAKKVIAVDCDNTLWNGICGENTPDEIIFDSRAMHLQRFLKTQSEQGMLLCLCSKNEETDVFRLFNARPDMVLNPGLFAAYRINWNPKSENIRSLAAELNLGIDSFIFIDDNEVECSEVRLNCPGVTVIHWPLQGDDPVATLSQCWVFDHFTVTEEDRNRNEVYRAETQRKAASGQSSDFRSFIESLGLDIDIEAVTAETCERASQLTMRTNQFNFTTIRRQPAEIQKLMTASDAGCYTVKATDRFGAYGIIGIIILRYEKQQAVLDTFLLSCRVLGRGIEHRMMQFIAEQAESRKLKTILVNFINTVKNRPAGMFLEFLEKEYGGIPVKTETGTGKKFKPDRLISCSYSSYTDTGIPADTASTDSVHGIPGSPEKISAGVPHNSMDMIRFWTDHRNLGLIEERTGTFRSSMHGIVKTAGPGKSGCTGSTSETGLSREELLEKVRQVFLKYSSKTGTEIENGFFIEDFGFESRDIVSVTSELSSMFPHIPLTLLFECRTFSEVVDVLFPPDNMSGQHEPEKKTGTSASIEKNNLHAGLQEQTDIAVIGMSCIYPGARDIYELWQNLAEGISSFSEIPGDRWNMDQYFSPDESDTGKSYSRWGGFIEDADRFDAAFFHIPPGQAALMDPQQRLFLQVVWNLIEDAGYDPGAFEKNTGVFAGVIASDYGLFQNWLSIDTITSFRNCEFYQAANRISYIFDFRGPSMTIDTACSASGTAIHTACRSILDGDCACAIAGGLNLILHPSRYIQYSHAGLLSRNSLCRPFAADADGTVIGEGIGAILLKPYSRALEDGDHVRGVIKGSAINSGGKTTGFTVPNPLSQQEVISRALRKSSIDPRTISYIEAHGTGTALGDPIEIRGLSSAFRETAGIDPGARQYCAIGSIKSNIGHLESGAAIAGIIKILLQFQFRTIVPSLHAETLNPKIDFADSPFFVQQKKTGWKEPVIKIDGEEKTFPLRAGISSFGAGGSNSHIILECPATQAICQDAEEKEYQLVMFSAQNRKQLVRYLEKTNRFLHTLLSSGSGLQQRYTIRNIAYTLGIGRKHMEMRLAVIAGSVSELAEKLCIIIDEQKHIPVKTGRKKMRTQDSRREKYFIRRVNDKSGIGAMLAGNAGRAFADTAVRERDLDALAEFWVSGGNIPAGFFSSDSSPCRVSLPGIPFRGKQYRIKEYSMNHNNRKTCQIDIGDTNSAAFQDAPADSLIDTAFFIKQYTEKHEDATETGIIQGNFVIFGGNRELNTLLCGDLSVHAGNEHRLVFVAESEQLPDTHNNNRIGHVEIQSYGYDECVKAMKQLQESGIVPGYIINLCAFFPAAPGNPAQPGYSDAGFFSVSAVCTQLFKSTFIRPVRMFYFFPVHESDDDLCHAEHAGLAAARFAVAGFGRTACAEQAGLDFRSIGISLPDNNMDNVITVLAGNIKNELLHQRGETESIRNGSAFSVPRIRRINCSELRSHDRSILPHHDGVYIVTGGLGGIGKIVAEYLVSCFRARVILCGRQNPDSEKMNAIISAAVPGASAEYISVDVSDEKQVSGLVHYIKEKYGKISGIFHCAGIIHDAFIINRKKSNTDAVIAPKITGAVNLDNATKDDDIDFILFFSSLSAVIGNPGQADYAYANAFLDNFAIQRNRLVNAGKRKGFTASINWQYWENGGMKMDEKNLALYMEETGVVPLPAENGIEIIHTVLTYRIEQSIPCYGNSSKFLHALHREYPETSENICLTESASVIDDDSDIIKEFLKNTLGHVTKIHPKHITEEIHFENLGIDSIAVRMFSHEIEKKIGRVSGTLLYECHSLNDLTAYFSAHYGQQIKEMIRNKHGKSADCPDKKTCTNIYQVKNNDVQHKNINRIQSSVSCRSSEMEFRQTGENDIAIIGMSGMYPMAENPDEYWENLKSGKDCITEIPADRWDNTVYYSPDKSQSIHGKYYCKWGGFIPLPDGFDPLFFSISPKDARAMDPQERLFLEMAWSALEDAGYNREELVRILQPGSEPGHGAPVGVFAGITTNDYQLLGSEYAGKSDVIGSSLSWSIANRVSYVLDLTGPSMAVDGACSSSLMAIYLACESLRHNRCRTAIAGAVNIFLHPFKYILNSQKRMLSSKGRCFTFSSRADGFVPAEGAGALVLKKLSEAIADNDHIYAVIKSIAVNHGGKSNGFTVPNPDAQARVIDAALSEAGINPETISYLEAHGTGTILGDPTEIAGLSRVFGKYTDRKQFCTIGSVKANIGHAEAAAGIASVTKVILQMKNRWITPSLYADALNPDIDFSATPFLVRDRGMVWEKPVIRSDGKISECPRRAGISSFGAGGANAHLVLEEAPCLEKPVTTTKERYIIPLSAMTMERLDCYAEKLRNFINRKTTNKASDDITFNARNIAFTLAAGREQLKHRLAVIASTKEEILNLLNLYCSRKDHPDIVTSQKKPITGNSELHTAAASWAVGEKIRLRNLVINNTGNNRTDNPVRISLPAYPFRKTRHWLYTGGEKQGTAEVNISADRMQTGSFLTGEIHQKDNRTTEFIKELSIDSCSFLGAHLLFGRAVLSGPTQTAMLFEAIQRITGSPAAEILWMDFLNPVIVGENEHMVLNLVLEQENNDFIFSFRSSNNKRDENLLTIHSSGKITSLNGSAHERVVKEKDPADGLSGALEIPADVFYARLEEMGYRFDNSFKCITGLRAGNGSSVSTIRNPAAAKAVDAGNGKNTPAVDPGIIDSCIQMLLPTLPENVVREKPHSIYVPIYISGFLLAEPFGSESFCYGKRILWDEKRETLTGHLLIEGIENNFIGKVEKLRLKRVDSHSLLRNL